MATLRHDLFLCFGLWHAYSYAHIAVWTAFRHTFLADVFWSVFPKQRLLRRPPLVQSSTLFTWLRFAYPYIRPQLLASINEMRDGMLTYDIKLVESLESGVKVPKLNPYRARYIHLINLQTLFEFCIPVIQDYGVALKSNDWVLFSQCYVSLVSFFVMCNGQGVGEYQRSLYCFTLMLRYWTHHELPIMTLLRSNHTLFSEESGEIALSVLSTSQPSSNRTKLEQVRKAWQFVRSRFDLHSSTDGYSNKNKKYRILSKSFLFSYLFIFFIV
jgi:hypothetical protein